MKEHPIQKISSKLKSVLQLSPVLVPTRPVAMEQLSSDFASKVEQHVQIFGFTDKEIDGYIQSSRRNQPDLLKNLHSYISQHLFAASVMHTEQHFAIKTLTELYTVLFPTLLHLTKLQVLFISYKKIP